MTDDEKSNVDLLDHPDSQPDSVLKPVVLKYKKSKKKDKNGDDERKEKYSRGLKDIQRLEGNITRISQKATKALSKGMDTYERERQQSAKQKTDGVIEDFIQNTAKAGSTYLKEAADIPVDIAEAVSPRSYRKRLRRNLHRASKFIRLWRI